MEYPSFIWGGGLRDNEERQAVISENVLTDLKISGMVRNDIKRYQYIPCSKDEILKRHSIYKAIDKNPEIIPALEGLKNKIIDYKKIYAAYSTSENPTERVMFFAVLVSIFLEICTALSKLEKTDEVFCGISGFYREYISDSYFEVLEGDIRECMLYRREDVRATVNGSSISAVQCDKTIQSRFEKWFEIMGIPESFPQNKPHRRLDGICIEAYANIYRSYYLRASGIHQKYSGALFGGEYNITDIMYYNDEISFIIDTARYIDKFKKLDYPLCYPKIADKRQVEADGLIDAALIQRELSAEEIIPNDVRMYSDYNGEKLNFYILCGANGGGKTTYLRSVGTALLMFMLGLPILAKRGEIYPFKQLFTHFPSNESFENSGRFIDEANRADEITSKCDADSAAFFNETYSGTDERKSEEYSSRLASDMYARGVFGIFVTHIHSLTNGDIPVLAAVVDESDENKRTYKIRRVTKTNSSYAYDILKKYQLDRESLESKYESLNI